MFGPDSLNDDKNEISSLFELYDEPSIFDFYDDAFFDEYENQINIKSNASFNFFNFKIFLFVLLIIIKIFI